MGSLLTFATQIDRQVLRFRSALNVVGGVCFFVIAADYARFINLPTFVTIPVWLGVLLNIFRWAIWEGMIKPHAQPSAEHTEPKE